MKKVIRNVIAVLLCVTGLLLLVLPFDAMNAATDRNDFVFDGSTLVKYHGNEADLTLPDTVRTIGKDVFSGNISLRNVTIPEGVRTIDYAAFENCTNLKTVSIPKSVRTIGSSAFSGCTSLYRISIPEKVETLGSGVFAGCTSLSSIPVADENMNFICQDGVVYSGNGKTLVQYLAGRPSTTYVFPDSIEKIEEYAFWGASNLTGISISNRVKEIPEYAFSNCSGLSTVIIPTSVTRLNAYSFADCPNLRSIMIPTSVGYIDDLAFYLSEGVTINRTEPSQTPPSDAALYSPPESTSDTENAESNFEGQESGTVTDGSEVSAMDKLPPLRTDYEENIIPGEMGAAKIVGNSAVLLMSPSMEVKDAYHLSDAELEDGIGENNAYHTGAGEEFSIIRSKLVKYNGNGGGVTIPKEVSAIGNRVFYKEERLTEMKLPNDLRSIGDFSFARSSLSQLDIPAGTEEIGYAAFYQCKDLTAVSIPDSVKTIELGAFSGTPWLMQWYQKQDTASYLIVGDGILLGYKGEGGNITIPDGVRCVASGCFSGNLSLTGVTFPSSVEIIGEDAFNGCSMLNTVAFGNRLTKIEDRAFRNTALSAFSLPVSVTSVGLGAFDVSESVGAATVLFQGDRIPDVSCKPTAGRLSAEQLRTLALNGVENAVLKTSADPDSGNLFDPMQLGFRGAVYTFSPKADNNQNTLHLIRLTKEPDDFGVVSVDSHIKIGSAEYLLDGVKEDALSPYQNIGAWCDKPLSDVRISGNTSAALDRLLGSIRQSIPASRTEENAISVQLRASDFNAAQESVASARIAGNTTPYFLNVDDGQETLADFNAAFQNAFGAGVPRELLPLSIEMTDATGTVPIRKLNRNRIEITLPVPKGYQNVEDLIVLSLDDNGSLETLSTARTEIDGIPCFRFVTGHFSPYAICRRSALPGNTGETTIQEETLASPDKEAVDLHPAYDLFSVHASSGSLQRRTGITDRKTVTATILLLLGGSLLLFNVRSRRSRNGEK